MNLSKFLTAFAVVVSIGGGAHADNTVKKPTAPKASVKAAAVNAATELVKIDAVASEIGWTGRKVLVKSAHSGTLKLKGGEIQLVGTEIKTGSFEIDMTSLTNLDLKDSPDNQKKLLSHLRSDDFFSIEKHPTATFKITSVKALAGAKAGAPTHEISGDLTIKGITKPVNPFAATVTTKDGKVTAMADLKFDRTNWDVRYNSGKFFENLGDKVIADDIELKLNLVAAK